MFSVIDEKETLGGTSGRVGVVYDFWPFGMAFLSTKVLIHELYVMMFVTREIWHYGLYDYMYSKT
jgi:hypothetical protein